MTQLEKNYTVSIIMPTTCHAARATNLLRAIESAVNQADVSLELLLVVNGTQYDRQLVSSLERDKRLQLIYLEDANVSTARYVGLCAAKGDYFCFLDDDDEFLPNALNMRVTLFNKYAEIDVVVTNGLIHIAGTEKSLVQPGSAREIRADPGLSFLNQNWFASPASLFKRKSIDLELFNFTYKYFEWTYLFFLLLSKSKKFHFEDVLTYIKYEDNPLSISKSIEYSMAYPGFLHKLGSLALPSRIKHRIHAKYVVALNIQSNLRRSEGCIKAAWISHLKCVKHGGWQYLPYTLQLIKSSLKRR